MNPILRWMAGLACAAALAAGCTPPKPAPLVPESAGGPPPDPAPSRLAIRVSINSRLLNDKVNALLSPTAKPLSPSACKAPAPSPEGPGPSGTAQSGAAPSGPRTSHRAVRTYASSTAPVAKAEARFPWHVCLDFNDPKIHLSGKDPASKVSHRLSFSSAGLVTGKTDLHIDRAWHLHAHTELEIPWQEDELAVELNSTLEWFGRLIGRDALRIDVTPAVEPVLDRLMPFVASALDRIVEDIDLRRTLSDGWTALQRPLMLSKEDRVWMHLQPDSLAARLNTAKGEIALTAALVGKLTVGLGDPPQVETMLALPENRAADAGSDATEVNLRFDTTYEELSRVVNLELAKQEKPTVELPLDASVTLKQIRLTGEGALVRIEAAYEAKNLPGPGKGTRCLMWSPRHDPAWDRPTLTSILCDPKRADLQTLTDHDLDTWLLPKVTESIHKQLEEKYKAIKKALEKQQSLSVAGVTVQTKFSRVSPPTIRVGPDLLAVYLQTDGEVSLEVEKL